MSNTEVIEGNKLIAEFMGAKYYEAWSNEIYHYPEPTYDFGEPDNYPTPSSSRYYTPAQLQYDTLWDWLCPVLFRMGKKSELFSWPANSILLNASPIYDVIETFWREVIKFIQWYNSLTNKTNSNE